MAIRTTSLNRGEGVEIELSGTVYGHEIIAFHKAYFTERILDSLRYRIIDKSRVEENYVSVEEVQEIALLDKELAKANPRFFTAVIAPGHILELSPSIWMRLLRSDGSRNKVFGSREEAEKWLNEINPSSQ